MARRKQNLAPWILGGVALYMLARPRAAAAAPTNGNGITNGNGNGTPAGNGFVAPDPAGWQFEPVNGFAFDNGNGNGNGSTVYLGETCRPPQPIGPGEHAGPNCKFRAILPPMYRPGAGSGLLGLAPMGHSGWSIPQEWYPGMGAGNGNGNGWQIIPAGGASGIGPRPHGFRPREEYYPHHAIKGWWQAWAHPGQVALERAPKNGSSGG